MRGILVEVEFGLKSVEIEVVTDEFLVHLAEKLMVLKTAEPRDPSTAFTKL